MQNGEAGNAEDLTEATDLEKADVELGKEIGKRRHHPAVKAASKFGKLGDQGPLYALSAGLLVIGILTRNRRLTGSALSMGGAIALADRAKCGVKAIVHRTRPNVLLEEGVYKRGEGGSEDKEEQSFPSGHTAGSVAVARALSRHYPAAGAGAGVAALAVGLSRVAKGSHWPLDIVAGAIIGFASEAIATHVIEQGLKIAEKQTTFGYLPIMRPSEANWRRRALDALRFR
ncbi:MAG: phosphatase PAP2 family protein [Chthoniobacterales bacterium]|nr:phosphatase PAP2 family protein [Chthoniobacterales bacterium]